MTHRSFLVMPRKTKIAQTGLKTGKGRLTFKRGQASMTVGDESLANEIDTEYGLHGSGDVWVARDEMANSWLRDERGTHRYFWGSNSAYRRGWDSIFGKKNPKKGRAVSSMVANPVV